ncbi:hypothetical protein L1281_001827 [Neisseria sp. HSC-16F19]|nr:hypothetical protein [Neisseria sp. HSC-16F19]MCP2041233.1 hypothetical protein [Neisseria sp. HSC-16F19]
MIYTIAATLLTAALLYTLLFEDRHELAECVKYIFKPDIISLLQGKWHDDIWMSFKLSLWLAVSTGVGVLVYINFG